MNRPSRTRRLAAGNAGIEEAVRLIAAGRPVAIPTETVYGLAADARSAAAVARIYEAKGRPSFNPLIVHIADLDAALALGEFDDAARALADQHWPGALTLVVPARQNDIASIVTAGLSSIALRCPAHPVMRDVLKRFGGPLAAPSANASGRISPTTADHVLTSLDGRIDAVIDGGPCKQGIESTIVAATGGPLRLLRRGPVDVDAAESVVTNIEAPGQLSSHYAPSKPLRLDATTARGDEILIGYAGVTGDLTLGRTPAEAAARLFAMLHEADASDAARIAVAPIQGDGLAAAIRDRLSRAATPA